MTLIDANFTAINQKGNSMVLTDHKKTQEMYILSVCFFSPAQKTRGQETKVVVSDFELLAPHARTTKDWLRLDKVPCCSPRSKIKGLATHGQGQ